ncbi:MAG: cysteine-rich CWC family protein [Acidovorax sp.]|uniref:cysteine-rich CWC family protein n=1 Tax=Acidovorax sp. TaxID=1872122 RepID=UPI0025BBF1DF|nr:cysteine-rich CWC family protein [Acidovorax sp.]MCE1193861.1 cysteine-rich CWC family protein [Acidovorax sp.]
MPTAALPLDPAACPLCGGANACALAQGLPAEHCWCMRATLNPAALAAVPEALRRKACICARCGTHLATPASTAAARAPI